MTTATAEPVESALASISDEELLAAVADRELLGRPVANEEDAKNVVQAIRRVIRDLPAIGKDGVADPKQGGYAYRGIEQITRAAQPLLARHCVIFTPYRILDSRTREILVNSKPWTDESLIVQWRVYGPGGRDDFIEIETPAIGRDNSDKGRNKCMTQAFKYALLPTLCISDQKDDADGTTSEADAAPAPVRGDDPAQRSQVDAIRERVRELRTRGVNDVATVNEDKETTILGVELLARNEDGDLVAVATVDAADALIEKLDELLLRTPPVAKQTDLPSTVPIEDAAAKDAEREEERLDQSTCPACGADVSALNVLHSPEGPCDVCARYGDANDTSDPDHPDNKAS